MSRVFATLPRKQRLSSRISVLVTVFFRNFFDDDLGEISDRWVGRSERICKTMFESLNEEVRANGCETLRRNDLNRVEIVVSSIHGFFVNKYGPLINYELAEDSF